MKSKKYYVHILFLILSVLGIWIITLGNEPVMKTSLQGLDAAFHFSRITSLSDIWTSPVNFDYFNHVGSMVNLFYPWLFVYPMYFIYLVMQNLVLSFYLYFMLMTFVTLEITYFCAKRMNITGKYALLAAILYAFSLCRISNIYFRVAIGEAVAMTFLPLVVYGCYELFFNNANRWGYLTAGMVCIIYSHVISTLLAAILVLFFFVGNIVLKKWNKQRGISFLKCIAWSIVLSLGFFGPMLEMMVTTRISVPMVYHLLESAVSPQDLVLQSLNNNAGSINTYGLIFLILLIFLGINYQKLNSWYRLCTIGIGIFTLLATKLFPWDFFQSSLMMIQFPWRFLAIGTVLITFSASYLCMQLESSSPHLWLIFIASTLFLQTSLLQNIKTVDGTTAGYTNEQVQQLIRGNQGFNGDRDYLPKEGTEDFPMIKAQKIKEKNQWKEGNCSFTATTATFEVQAKQNGTIILPIYHYIGEKVEYNGKPISVQKAENGATKVPIKKGSNQYIIRYNYTLWARICQMISGGSLLVAFYLLMKKYNDKKRGL